MNTTDFVFSASSVKDYLQCGLKFKFERIDKVEKTSVSSHHRWFGTLVHNLIYMSLIEPTEDFKKTKLTGKVNSTYPLKIFERVWNEKETDDKVIKAIREDSGKKPEGRFMRGKIISLGSSDEEITQKQLEKGWKAEAKKMVKNGISVVKDIHEILEIEKRIYWMLHKKRFVGYIDVLAKDENGKYEFYDFKTAWDKPGKRLEDDIQFFSYSYAIKRRYNLDYYPKGHFVHLRSGDAIEYNVTRDIERSVIRKITGAFENMELNIFFADYGGPLCPYCDFRHICYGEDSQVWKTASLGG